MILTYKLKHNTDFSKELAIAKKVAEFSIGRKYCTSKDVKHLGLKSEISNAVMRKYGRSKTLKEVRNVKLACPGRGVKINQNILTVRCLKLNVDIQYIPKFEKVNYVEVGEKYIYIAVTHTESPVIVPAGSLGVDRNSTKHIVVCASSDGSIVRKMGKQAPHIHRKYKSIRTKLQRLGKYSVVKKIKQRESNIVRNINHHISKKLIEIAKTKQLEIKLEDLSGIRKAKVRRKQRYTLNSWSFYQLEQFVNYKAKKQGVTVSYVDPHYTSKSCSKCGYIGIATNTKFVCQCGYVTHRDCNASFNIANLVVGNCIEKKIYASGVLIPADRQLKED